MKDKVVFITGANGGLGTSVTSAFLQQGAHVIGASRQIAAADFPGSNFEPLATDFNKIEEIRRCVSKIIEHYGRLDVLVHVLGGFAGGPTVAETPDEMWEQMLNLNLTAAFRVFRETIPHLRKSGAGRLIAIGSLAAVQPHASGRTRAASGSRAAASARPSARAFARRMKTQTMNAANRAVPISPVSTISAT